MSNNIKYPVKYVILSLKDKRMVKTLKNTEEYYDDIFAYVVVKALVINEIKTYNQNGGYTTSYDVVPEWKQDEYNIEPKYNLYGRCYNTINVECDLAFHNLDDAKRCCRELNNSLLSEQLVNHNVEFISKRKLLLKEKTIIYKHTYY